MIQVRNGVFETNSSSTHSLTMCMESDYIEWSNGKVYLNDGWGVSTSPYKDKKFVTKEEVIDILMHKTYKPSVDLYDMNEEDFEEYVREDGYYTFDNYDNEYLEPFEETFVTPNGEKVICFGQYGYDG